MSFWLGRNKGFQKLHRDSNISLAPKQFGGYREILAPKKRYSLIVHEKLSDLLGLGQANDIAVTYQRACKWSESVAVGGKPFITELRDKLGLRVKGRAVIDTKNGGELRETVAAYKCDFWPKKDVLRSCNRYCRDGFSVTLGG